MSGFLQIMKQTPSPLDVMASVAQTESRAKFMEVTETANRETLKTVTDANDGAAAAAKNLAEVTSQSLDTQLKLNEARRNGTLTEEQIQHFEQMSKTAQVVATQATVSQGGLAYGLQACGVAMSATAAISAGQIARTAYSSLPPPPPMSTSTRRELLSPQELAAKRALKPCTTPGCNGVLSNGKKCAYNHNSA